jgi:pimeloyl-ACP methyl ester carboxylesterase
MKNEQINSIHVKWYELDKVFNGLNTELEHDITVQREAIPLVFVPGIMGSVLRLSGTDGNGERQDGLPNLRWNPSSSYWMWRHYSGANATFRKNMIIGSGSFNKNFLEVHNSDPVGNGFQGVSSSTYLQFLQFLQDQNWGPLRKIFEFPVFAFGYNWTDTNLNNGTLLVQRIDEIIKEAKETTGLCEKVILITHSMGGLVSRAASRLAESKILGIIHGVQPVTGSAAAYWRVKAGFEGLGPTSRVLGNSARTVTPLLGNIPGGLELLPNKYYCDNEGLKEWLVVKENDKIILSLPKNDPYNEIYRIQGTGNELKNPDRKYWGLIDPDLLDAAITSQSDDPNDPDSIDDRARWSSWDQYLEMLKKAELFHETIKEIAHPFTFTFHGTDHNSSDRVEMITESVFIEWDSYPKRGFGGYYKNSQGKKRRAILQDPDGDGDGTVPTSSASFLDDIAQQIPQPMGTNVEHEPAYKNSQVREFVIRSIVALCVKRYEDKMGKKIDT